MSAPVQATPTPAPAAGHIPDTLASVGVDGRRVALHPADVRGRFITRRRLAWMALLGIYLALPLVPVGGHPAVHLDVGARRFYLFGATFNAQDFWIVVFLMTSAGFGLLFATTWLGRVWCGWACPQTVFLEGFYRPLERLIEGPREQRLRAARGPWTAGRLVRAGARHAAFLALSLLIAHAALAFFTSWPSLLGMIAAGPAGHEVELAWAMVVTGLLYFNFAWFREQMCVVICPYGRLQSVLQDRDSLIVGYDERRGEPRGRLRKAAMVAPVGDCVDCRKCVAACPTGIDIRDGLQMECVACAQCADACDGVMDKLGRPRGLIRYDSLNGLAGEKRRVLRPRLVFYGTLLAASLVALGLSLARRSSFEANLLRMRGAPYVLEGSAVRNGYELHLVNKRPGPTTFRVEVKSPLPARVVLAPSEVRLGSLESYRLPFHVSVERAALVGPLGLDVLVTDVEAGQTRHVPARFLAPGL